MTLTMLSQGLRNFAVWETLDPAIALNGLADTKIGAQMLDGMVVVFPISNSGFWALIGAQGTTLAPSFLFFFSASFWTNIPASTKPSKPTWTLFWTPGTFFWGVSQLKTWIFVRFGEKPHPQKQNGDKTQRYFMNRPTQQMGRFWYNQSGHRDKQWILTFAGFRPQLQ